MNTHMVLGRSFSLGNFSTLRPQHSSDRAAPAPASGGIDGASPKTSQRRSGSSVGASLPLAKIRFRRFYYCTVCIVVVDAEDSGQRLLYSKGSKCRHWMKSRRRSSVSARHWLGLMHSATSSPASSASWKRPSVCLRDTAKPRRQEGEPQPTPRPRLRKPPLQRDHAGASAPQPENRLAASAARRRWGIR